MKLLVKMFLLAIMLNACAAGMAVTTRPSPALTEIGIGSKREDAEELLGLKEKTMVLKNGQRIDYYIYKSGTYPSAARAIFHSTMSIGTSGLWEFIGIPLEEFNRRDRVIAITYNKRDEVIDIATYEPIN